MTLIYLLPDEILNTDLVETHLHQKHRRRLRRKDRIRKQNSLLQIVQDGHYAPQRGYIDCGFNGKTLLHSGKHIKHPKNSNYQRAAKKLTSKKIRRYPDVPAKGNHYRRLFDYYWVFW